MDQNIKSKSFWDRPEGKTGTFFGLGILAGGAYLAYKALPYLISFATGTLQLSLLLVALGGLLYMVLDPKMRNLIWYMYKNIMRWITGVFVNIDPIGILKSYIEDLKRNLSKMDQQLSKLKGQMHKLKESIINNQRAIKDSLSLASKAKETNKESIMILKSRQAGRLTDSNLKLEDLYKKMEILYRVLSKMRENSEIMMEDISDQVLVKEQERSAIRASHSAMKSAMSIISGDKDQRAMFDQALEAIADDVSAKVGEMERFMEMSSSFMDSIDLQNGVFEEEGMKMLEKWEKEGASLMLGNEKNIIINQANDDNDVLDLNSADKLPEKVLRSEHKNQYDTFFE